MNIFSFHNKRYIIQLEIALQQLDRWLLAKIGNAPMMDVSK